MEFSVRIRPLRESTAKREIRQREAQPQDLSLLYHTCDFLPPLCQEGPGQRQPDLRAFLRRRVRPVYPFSTRYDHGARRGKLAACVHLMEKLDRGKVPRYGRLLVVENVTPTSHELPQFPTTPGWLGAEGSYRSQGPLSCAFLSAMQTFHFPR